jgi:hypothetical protein
MLLIMNSKLLQRKDLQFSNSLLYLDIKELLKLILKKKVENIVIFMNNLLMLKNLKDYIMKCRNILRKCVIIKWSFGHILLQLYLI